MDEIRLLQSLRGKDNIIQLVDAEVGHTAQREHGGLTAHAFSAA